MALFVAAWACLLLTVVVGQVFGAVVGSALGLLMGVPFFFGFPLALKVLVGRWLVFDAEGREHGWGFLFLLGLAGLFLVIVGSKTAGELVWSLRAEERSVGSLAEVEAHAGERIIYRRSPSWTVLDGPLGKDYSSFYLGDAQRVETYSLVAPLVDRTDSRPGCVWIGRRLDDARTVRIAQRELVADLPLWLSEPVGVEGAGYADAVADALGRTEGFVRGCPRPVILVAAGSRADAIASSLRRLALLFGLAHGLPMVLLAGWLAMGHARRNTSDVDDSRSVGQ